MNTAYISNVTQNPGLLPIAAVSVSGGRPSLSLVIKTLVFAWDIGSLVVIGRFRDLSITSSDQEEVSHMIVVGEGIFRAEESPFLEAEKHTMQTLQLMRRLKS